MNSIYLYDGDFSSLVCLIVELLKRRITPDGIRVINNNDKSLFDCEFYIEIKNKRGNIEYFKKMFSRKIIRSIYYVFLSENKNREMIIYEFLITALKYKDKVYYYRNLGCVNSVIKLSGYVSREAHKLKGFLRFREMKNDFLYAVMSPTNNVIGILGNHFKNRLKNENFVIYDQLRKIYLIYDQVNITYLSEKDILSINLVLSDDEMFVEDLWINFHKAVAIKERENLKCQMSFMPKKYWNNMIEMEDKL